MPSFGYEDDHCGAAVGIGGWTACQHWPQCGCTNSDTPMDPNAPQIITESDMIAAERRLMIEQLEHMKQNGLTLDDCLCVFADQ